MNSSLYLYNLHRSCLSGAYLADCSTSAAPTSDLFLLGSEDCRSLLGFHVATLQSGKFPQAESQDRHEAHLLCFSAFRD